MVHTLTSEGEVRGAAQTIDETGRAIQGGERFVVRYALEYITSSEQRDRWNVSSTRGVGGENRANGCGEDEGRVEGILEGFILDFIFVHTRWDGVAMKCSQRPEIMILWPLRCSCQQVTPILSRKFE